MRNWTKKALVLLSLFILSLCYEYSDEDDFRNSIDFDVDRSDYVDPFDMFNYDPIALRHAGRKLKQNIEKDTVGPFDKFNYESNNPHDQREKKNNVYKENVLCGERPFLKRFLRILSYTMQLEERTIEEGEILHIPLTALVTRRTLSVLQEYLDEEEKEERNMIAELDEILSNLIQVDVKPEVDSEVDSKWTWSSEWLYHMNLQLKDCLTLIFVLYGWILFLMVYYRFNVKYISTTSFFFFLGISWAWHWHHLYQVATAVKQSHAMKNPEIPLACKPDQLPWFDRFKNHWFKQDPCEEYYKMMLTDSAYEISPLLAFYDLLATTVFHPAGYIGGKIGTFFDSLLEKVGWVKAIPILMTVVVLLVVLIILMCGYEVHLPFWFKIVRPRTDISDRESSRIESIKPEPKAALSHRPSVLILKVASSTLSPSSSSCVQIIGDGSVDVFEDCPEADIDTHTWNQIVEEIRGSSLCCQPGST